MLDLMDRELLQRDQILLLSKTRTGTEITSIHKKGARSDKSFKKGYLNGEFGSLQTQQKISLLFPYYIYCDTSKV